MAGIEAGRLSVSIVADIARLQKDLDNAKRAVRAASQDIGDSARNAGKGLDQMGTSMQGVTRSAGAQRAGMQQLSYQLGDVATMYALGAKPMQIFASQSGQVLQAVQLMSGGTSKFAGFLGGPWGIAIMGAVTVLGSLISSTQEETAAIETLEQRFDFAALSAEQLRQVNELLADSNADIQRTALGAANAMLTYANANKRAAEAALDAAEAELARVGAFMTDPTFAEGAAGMQGYLNAAEATQAHIDGLRESIRGYRQQSNMAAFDVAILTAGMSEQERQAESLRTRIDGLRQAYQATGSQVFLNQAIALQGQIDALGESTERATRSTRTRTRAISEDTRAVQQATREIERYNASLFDEIAQRTLSEEALFDRRVEQERSNAVAALAVASTEAETLALQTQIAVMDETVAVLRRLNAEEAERNQLISEREKIAEAEQNYQDKIKDAAEEAADARERAMEEAYRREEDQIRDLADIYTTLFTGGVDDVWDVFEKQGLAVIGTLAAQWTLSLLAGNPAGQSNNPLAAIFGSAFGGAPVAANDNGVAGVAGPLAGLGSLFSGGGAGIAGVSSVAAPLGLAVAGVQLTNFVGEGIGNLLGTGYNKTAGGLFGIVGGLIGGLLGGSDRGSAIISGGGISGYYGDTQEYKDQAGGLAGTVLDSIAQIADALGADLNMGAGKVSIGIRDGNYVVDPQGRGYTKTSKFSDLQSFGQDADAAVAAAIADLLKDGVISGISQASQNILRAGGDLQEAIEKAVLIESIPKLLKERVDPLGAALDKIDAQFQKLADALREGGATAQQFADAEQLYNLERQAAAEQFGQSAQTLQDYLDSLAFGSNSPLSVRSQLESARQDFSQYEQAILSGETVDSAAFTSSAQALLGLSRQANASSSGFFADFERIRELTQLAIQNVGSGSLEDGSVVFAQVAANTRAQAEMQEDTNALLREQNALLFDALNNRSGGGGTFIGETRAFAA